VLGVQIQARFSHCSPVLYVAGRDWFFFVMLALQEQEATASNFYGWSMKMRDEDFYAGSGEVDTTALACGILASLD
jgi:hypothetical protein